LRTEPTKYQKVKRWFEQRYFIVAIIFAVIIITGLGSLIGSIEQIYPRREHKEKTCIQNKERIAGGIDYLRDAFTKQVLVDSDLFRIKNRLDALEEIDLNDDCKVYFSMEEKTKELKDELFALIFIQIEKWNLLSQNTSEYAGQKEKIKNLCIIIKQFIAATKIGSSEDVKLLDETILLCK